MIVVLEGQRGTGKTTLAKALNERLELMGISARVVKFERGEDPHRDMKKQIINMSLDNTSQVYIVDRFHMTEWAMRAFDTKIPNDKLMMDAWKIGKILEGVGSLVFILKCDRKVRLRRVAERNDGRGDEGTESLDLYWYQISETIAEGLSNHIVLNTTNAKVDELAASIADKVKTEMVLNGEYEEDEDTWLP